MALATVLSIMVLATMALIGGAIVLARRGGPRKQVLLMLLLAGIVAMNVAIWTVPSSTGQAPVDAADRPK